MKLFPVHCKSSKKFKITRTSLELAFEVAQKVNINVKGVLVTNPSNPIGTSYRTVLSIFSYIFLSFLLFSVTESEGRKVVIRFSFFSLTFFQTKLKLTLFL